MPRDSKYVRQLAGFALGHHAPLSAGRLDQVARHLGLCREARGLIALSHRLFTDEESTMVTGLEAATLTELIRLIDDVIEKSRRDRLKEQAQSFDKHYTFVLRYGWRHGNTEKCAAKEREVHAHWGAAHRAAEAGDANGLQEALARALDDLHELAECLGIDPVPF